LKEDYHALIRRYQFHISGGTVNVHREVQVSAHPTTATGESFVEGFPPHPHQAATEGDEPRSLSAPEPALRYEHFAVDPVGG